MEGRPPAQRYRLVVADADGYGPRVVDRIDRADHVAGLVARRPDASRTCRSKGKASAIYVQRLASGERRRVSARLGINGAPAWSPDGRKLALTLSRDGNLDIYVLDLAAQALTRLTTDEAIDTEPEWSADGASDLFHVGSGGQRPGVPRRREQRGRRAAADVHEQLQRATAQCRRTVRSLAMVTLDRGGYRIATFDLKTRNLHVLTDGAAGRVAELRAERRRDHLRAPRAVAAARWRWSLPTGVFSSG